MIHSFQTVDNFMKGVDDFGTARSLYIQQEACALFTKQLAAATMFHGVAVVVIIYICQCSMCVYV